MVVLEVGSWTRSKTLIQSGNRPYAVTAHFLTPDEGAERSYREVGRAVPLVRLGAAVGQRLP
ncbi:hypothetical protein [Streptomyces sp. NBC_00287]|uniref:hypothetical protein n=1 Tax=Streptomyces sp. NBC_00287 TaxID=2975702 RepID=UPI003FA71BC5